MNMQNKPNRIWKRGQNWNFRYAIRGTPCQKAQTAREESEPDIGLREKFKSKQRADN